MVLNNNSLQSQIEELTTENNQLLSTDSLRKAEIENINKTNQNLVDWINTHNMRYHQSINQVEIENVTASGFLSQTFPTIESTVSMDILNNGTNTINGLVVTATNNDPFYKDHYSRSVALNPLNASESRKVSLPVFWDLGKGSPTTKVTIEVLLNQTLIKSDVLYGFSP